jgi:hypothetical protein
MVNWLSKKTRPALISVEASKLEEIVSDSKVNIVVHGAADSASGKIVEEIAVADDYNSINSTIKPTMLWLVVTSLKELLKSTGLSEMWKAQRLLLNWRIGLAHTNDPLSTLLMRGQSAMFLENKELASFFSIQEKLATPLDRLLKKLLRKSESTKANPPSFLPEFPYFLINLA